MKINLQETKIIFDRHTLHHRTELEKKQISEKIGGKKRERNHGKINYRKKKCCRKDQHEKNPKKNRKKKQEKSIAICQHEKRITIQINTKKNRKIRQKLGKKEKHIQKTTHKIANLNRKSNK